MSKQITIRLPQELLDKLKKQAEGRGYPVKDYVVFALRGHFNGKEYGGDVKNMGTDNRARFTFRMPEELYQMLDERAEELGVSKNALILQILWDYVEKRRNAH